jgi:demethylmenaquinone methyltransferase/2-methoxy-6-polyprenyl-1,4-benzoquinol methylase
VDTERHDAGASHGKGGSVVITDPGAAGGTAPAVKARADLRKQPREVSAMFDDVAERYDRTNSVLSAGQDRLWRTAVLRAVDARPGETVLDLAAGTARSSEPFADRGVRIVPCDFSTGMVRAGKRRRPDLGFVVGDATRLPFADGVFDAATISFGLRNVVDPDAGLREMARVVRPGGRLVVCEFSTLPNPLLRKAYETYLHHGLPRVATLVSSHADAYDYLVDSIDAWPDQPALAARIAAAGWEQVAWRNLSFGVVAVHRAVRRAD